MTRKKKISLVCFTCAAAALITTIVIVFSMPKKAVTDPDITSEYFGFTREYYNYIGDEISFEDAVLMCDKTLDGQFVVNCRFVDDTFEYSLENFDWNAAYSDSPNSFQLYLQSMSNVQYMAMAYEHTGDEKYLAFAKELIISWEKYQKDTALTSQNAYVWNDHTLALRTENIIYFMTVYEKAGLADKQFADFIANILQMQIDKLLDEAYYTENHNHGIFQDQALLYASYFLNNSDSIKNIEFALDRLEEQRKFAFTEEMVHVENSPGYHLGVTNQFYIIANFLTSMKSQEGRSFIDNFNKAAEYIAWTTLPNGNLAILGDTENLKEAQPMDEELVKFNNNTLSYLVSGGQSGSKPNELSKIYPFSGYYYARSTWDAEKLINSTWTNFKSGYSTRSHKHADDTSFLLYSKGYEIFADSGLYNYMVGGKYRDYCASSLAHNVVSVDGKSYSVCPESSGNTGILDYNLSDDLDYVLGYNDMYQGVSIDRHFYNFGDAIVIYDNILSDETHTYSQIFHLSEHMKLVSSSDSEVLAKIADSGYFVRIRQMIAGTDLTVHHGESDGDMCSVISRSANQVEGIDTCVFDAKGQNVDFITVITIENADGKVITDYESGSLAPYTDFYADPQTYTVYAQTQKGAYSSPLSPRVREGFENAVISCEGKAISLANPNSLAYGIEYGWEIIDSFGKTIEASSFSDKDSYSFSLTADGVYWIKSKIKHKYGSVKTKIIGAVCCKDGIFTDASKDYPCLNLIYNGHSIEKTGDNTYKFTVDYNCSADVKTVWHLYKNGGAYEYDETVNENSMEYVIDQPGDYTVIYYLKTTCGEIFYYNFDQLNIK